MEQLHPLLQWKGVTCGSRHQRVVSMNLDFGHLTGKLSPSISNLSFLRTLVLANNSLSGNIPHQISHLHRLRFLSLRNNSFEGEIPANLSHCLQLRTLDLRSNNLVGKIPHNIGRFKDLSYLNLGDNILSGTIPASLLNLSNLQTLELRNNKLHGYLPTDLGLFLPQLQTLCVMNNSLSGQLPSSLSNLSKLQTLEISYNSFMGSFSLNRNSLPNLQCLFSQNAFSLGGERDLSFLGSLTNCTKLQHLCLEGNSFSGIFPHSILNLSARLQILSLSENQISGQLPFGLGKFKELYFLGLQGNNFTGPIPADIGMLKSLQRFYLSYNNFSGEIPSSLGNLNQLTILDMSHNNLDGSLPKSLGHCKNLLVLSLNSNKFSGVLPVELLSASSLLNLSIGQNTIQGSLPNEISMLKNLFLLDISHNRFSGEIPGTLGECTSLSILNMSDNSFVGSIPELLSPLKSIIYLDLSCNNLCGQIPNYFPTWPLLLSLNLFYNYLDGEVPSDKVFANTSTLVSISGNNKLCGGVLKLQLPKCPSPRRLSLEMIMIISILCVLVVVLSLALCFYMLCLPRKKKDSPSRLQDIKPFLEISYQRLLKATNGFSPTNLIGTGGFGSVYKGILHQDDKKIEVAVKVLNLENEGASKSFITECNALRNIRHRNLVKIITACSSIDTQLNEFKALVYEFIPKGSLERWLYLNLVTSEHDTIDQSCTLSLFQRLSIVIDVATALEYLHIQCANPIIHCDLKPSNILLNDDMAAQVGDFGLAKILLGVSSSNNRNQSSTTQVRGTVGYTAPEYGLGSSVSAEGDVYSFGIIVLEMMTSKKPTDPMFSDGLNLHDFAKSALPNQVMEIIDRRMLGDFNVIPRRNNACADN